MKKKLLLFLSKLGSPSNTPIAATLAWLCHSKGYIFDNYYDSYHEGIHFPGGDSRRLELGQMTGGVVCGDRHFEEFYFLLHNFDVHLVSWGETLFSSCVKNLNAPVVASTDRISDLYQKIFSFLEAPLPSRIVLIGSGFSQALKGLEAYLYPDIYYSRALGLPDSISDEELSKLCQAGSKIYCLYANEKKIRHLQAIGYDIEVIDRLDEDDDYLSISKKVVNRWEAKIKGWLIGDPILVSHWLPKACEEDLLAVYSVPQEEIIAQLGDLISTKGNVVFGRQYSDKDFFKLSEKNQCLQVIDPYRPPFQSVKHAEYNWHIQEEHDGFFAPEYSDEELRQFAEEGRVLISLMFWSGMIRETANLYNLMDLFAITRLRCGLVLTSQSFDYMMHPPLELLALPLDQGGVFPNVEPVLGSCGLGVGIEALMTEEKLIQCLRSALEEISLKVKNPDFVPRGWWATMDSRLEKLGWWERPKALRTCKSFPFIQIRYRSKADERKACLADNGRNCTESAMRKVAENVKDNLRKIGWDKYFIPYRPYEFYKAGPVSSGIIKTVKSAGLRYMFTKSGFDESPEVKYKDDDFIALNYTAGQWDGWTPFETINDVLDLKRAERSLSKRNRPGWIVSTIDSCLWTFSGEMWKRSHKLYEIARFCAEGGNSGRLINTKPYTISRYARIVAEKDI
ncbi:hypothetical protein ACFLR7_00435 [Acidobacteriota bacterium]